VAECFAGPAESAGRRAESFQPSNAEIPGERQFVESLVADAETALRAAEDRMQTFLQGNRVIESPQLVFARDRLQRDITLRQQVFNSLVQSREEARIREVRDTPVITVLESGRLPTMQEPRKSVQKALVGGIMGGVLGVLFAFLAQRLAIARETASPDSREFFGLLEESVPRFLRPRRA
jgi:uncharacterized protein involved in exopolysaccharide biosynthesis